MCFYDTVKQLLADKEYIYVKDISKATGLCKHNVARKIKQDMRWWLDLEVEMAFERRSRFRTCLHNRTGRYRIKKRMCD